MISFVKMFCDRETRQVLLYALKVLAKTSDGQTGLMVPVAEHFNKAGHSIQDALVRGIMLCRKNVRRKRLEIRLIFQLGTSHQRGLKSDVSSRPRVQRATKFFSFTLYANIATFPTYFVTPLMKGQVRNVWNKTQTRTRHFCSLFFSFC